MTVNGGLVNGYSEWSAAWQQQVAGHLQRLKQQALTRGSGGEPLQQALTLEEQRLTQLALDHFTTPLYFFHPLVLINQLMPVVAQSVLVVLEMLSVLVPGIERHDCTLLLRYLNECRPMKLIRHCVFVISWPKSHTNRNFSPEPRI